MNNTFAPLALVLAVALLAPNAHARRDSENFGEALSSLKENIGRIDELQKESAGPFLIVGPRCLNNWDKYKKAYETVVSELKATSAPANQAISEYYLAVKNLQEGSPSLKLGEACSEKGKAIGKDILKRMVETKKLAKILSKIEKDVEKLSSDAYQVLLTDAEKDYGRGPSCLFQYQYTDVARLALFRDYYPRGEPAPAPALLKIKEDLHSAVYFQSNEEERLTKNLIRLNHLRMSCDDARDAGVTNEDDDQQAEEQGTGSAL